MKLLPYTSEPLAALDVEDRKLIVKLRQNFLTYLSDSKMVRILDVVRQIEDKKLAGLFIEAGCALGGSTILISSVKDPKRPMKVYDVFQTIPAPTQEDGEEIHKRYEIITEGNAKGLGGDTYYGYEKNLYEKVKSNLKKFGITQEHNHVFLIKGLVQDTLEINEPVVFAHIDVDWYEPVKICLERITPRLVVGGSIILDDYYDWEGCGKAIDEYFQEKMDQFHMDDSGESLLISRIKY
ncbi:TylF/MycF/NovP-related O-methyltransferase [Spirosoma sp. KNUC1025]|uniref:TylF/MycF/NovP-related O-methyltransferase n=1 Tax=Spirosoma sp. KNUC1025 TaxID=2894082 RepID=UPI00386D35DC|nr:TylF/MycF family methyltransferase [Spirosoma sp. KNUC1025]